jgi:hypothetical protein
LRTPPLANLELVGEAEGEKPGLAKSQARPGFCPGLKNYIASGSIGTAKVVSLHTDKDGLVVVENENFYASEVPPSHLTTAIAVETTPTHCGFNAAEMVAGWNRSVSGSAVACSRSSRHSEHLPVPCWQLTGNGSLPDRPELRDPAIV